MARKFLLTYAIPGGRVGARAGWDNDASNVVFTDTSSGNIVRKPWPDNTPYSDLRTKKSSGVIVKSDDLILDNGNSVAGNVTDYLDALVLQGDDLMSPMQIFIRDNNTRKTIRFTNPLFSVTKNADLTYLLLMNENIVATSDSALDDDEPLSDYFMSVSIDGQFIGADLPDAGGEDAFTFWAELVGSSAIVEGAFIDAGVIAGARTASFLARHDARFNVPDIVVFEGYRYKIDTVSRQDRRETILQCSLETE